MSTRKRIDFKLPEIIIEKMDSLCTRKVISRTNYLETLIRLDLKKRGLLIDVKEIEDHGTFEDWGWEEKPKLKKVI